MASLSPNKRVEERYNNIIKSKNDDRLYRGLVLTNKMKVLLISDPTTIKSAAAIDISAGSICDPDYLPGLAHLCEHMLPLGTKKYPEQNEYGTYLSRNGGTSNALTGTYNATFFFDISSEKLEGALDRLAQFFIAPLFTETLVELELNAINSEYEKDLVNDEYRLNHVDKIFARPDHPLSKFTMGNRETLDIIPKQRGINVRNELLKFHKEYYSANIMALCILGKESLDELEEIVVDLFSEVQDKEIKFPTWPEHPFDEKHFHTIRYIVPIRDVRYLEITFLISDVWKHHLSLFPYVSHIFEHEGKGSLLSTLKARGWCNSLISHIIYGFIIAFYLTEEGIKHIENIVQLMFQYINMIYLKGPIKEIYDIYSLTVQKKFEFKEKSLPLDYVRFTVEALQKCPINNVLYARYILTEWQPDLINEIIKTLTPQNIISICVAAKAYEPTANKTERWFGTKYKEEKLSKETMDMWINAGYNEDLKLPYKNKYIPTTININSQINNNVGKFPIILKDTSFIRLWYKKDDEFLVPKTEMMFHFVSPFANISPLNCNLTYMFVQLLQDSLNEDIHAAALAGLESKLSCCNSGILLTIGGYDDKQYLLLTNIVNRMINFKTDPKRFEILKENYIRELKNWATKSLHEYISVYLFNLLVQHSLLEEELLEYTAHLSVDRLQQFIPQFFSNMYVECLIYGNVTVKEAINIVSLIESMLTARMSHLIPLQKQLTLNREIKLDNGKCIT
ncbi:insulin-degrading enzyme [Monomorium pharaonis]|uniref:insulin-degrading enzyme n=1 Tax=Monomorium pharaonis TaxID=307658 RepID=UPI001747D2F8|nr:insulin-degrading enzyme [Monomorium pharaonis]